MPYELWQQIKAIEKRDELIDLLRGKPEYFRDFLLKRTSSGKVDGMFEDGRIKDVSEFDYLLESIKSAVFRAGGTSIIDWGIWRSGSQNLIISEMQKSSRKQFCVYGNEVDVPLGYVIELPENLYKSMAAAAAKIHEAICSGSDSPKVLSRVDYVVIDSNNAGIVDIGESNTTISLADGLHEFAGFGKGTLLGEYMIRMFRMQEEIVPDFNRLFFVAENERMIMDLPYEFRAMQLFCTNCGIESLIRLKKDFYAGGMIPQGTAAVRCFRGIPENIDAFKMVDDVSFIELYRKDRLHEILEELKKGFPENISIPRAKSFDFADKQPEELAEEMIDYAETHGIKEYVVKPSIKSNKKSSLAYLYSVENSVHKRQLTRALRRFIKEKHIPSIILEENVGSGIADGHKLEVRLHCFTD